MVVKNTYEIFQIKNLFYFRSYLTNYFLNKNIFNEFPAGICISRPPALSWSPALAPNLYLPALAPNLYLPALAPNLYLPDLAPNLYLPALAPNLYLPALAPNLYLPQFVFTPNLYLPSQPSLILHIPTLSPQFVFSGPGL